MLPNIDLDVYPMRTQKSFFEQNGGTYTQVGDVHPSERSFRRNSQYAKALDDLVKAGDALTDTLTEKQKEMFEDNFLMDDISTFGRYIV